MPGQNHKGVQKEVLPSPQSSHSVVLKAERGNQLCPGI